ncbi:MAG TPA: hypothetical protein VM818_05085 [Vicinamibacterales bacterium]|nr:hypothetical protein [Vicinamibacterales bacterium]
MAPRIDELLAHIAQLEREVEAELNEARQQWRYRIETGRIRFERDVRLAHSRLKRSLPRFFRESSPRSLLSAPFIYSMIVPIGLLDLWISLYQAVCFPLYGIAHVRRSSYIVIDRQHLGYLNAVEKLNCVYCGYANGVFAYVREIAGRTEQYWCPIRHAKRVRAPHLHYREFVDYGDAQAYLRELPVLRSKLKKREEIDS